MGSAPNSLFGTYTHKLDPKNRIAIPSVWRPSEGDALLLLCGKRFGLETVKVYTREAFAALVDKIKSEPNVTSAQVDAFVGRMYARCVESLVNAQGKLLIPKAMCDHAKLTTAVQLAGRGDYFELWEPSVYEEVLIREDDSISALNQSFGLF